MHISTTPTKQQELAKLLKPDDMKDGDLFDKLLTDEAAKRQAAARAAAATRHTHKKPAAKRTIDEEDDDEEMSEDEEEDLTNNPLTTSDPPTHLEEGSGVRVLIMLNNVIFPQVCESAVFFILRSHCLCCLPEPV